MNEMNELYYLLFNSPSGNLGGTPKSNSMTRVLTKDLIALRSFVKRPLESNWFTLQGNSHEMSNKNVKTTF